MQDETRRDLPSLADRDWLSALATQKVLSVLAAAGHEGRVVGGAVRNALLGVPVVDVDIATAASPECGMEVMRAAGLAAIPTGIEHGTITVVCDGRPFEVTTLRRDVETDGRRAVVAYTDDWTEDARRRDFTLNALYCDASGRVHDPLGGYPDLAARRVRFIGDAGERIREDYLRILRFFRVHATYGAGPLDRDGLLAAERNRDGLARLSAERVRAELLRVLVAPGAVAAIDAMQAHGILSFVLGVAPRPGLLASLATIESRLALSPDAVLRLSALALATEDDKARLARRLRLSGAEQRDLLVLDRRWGDRMATATEADQRRELFRLGAETWRRHVLAALAGGAAPGQFDALYNLPEVWPPPRFPLSGKHVLALGLPAGRDVGALLAAAEDWWVAHDFPPDDAVEAHLATLAAARKARP